jgi:peptidoglycan/xylan/chitin deacetylase (PgdA/CDA1 family)
MSRVLILMYHRFAEPGADPFGLAVSPRNFAGHVEHLAATGAVVPLAEVGARSRVPRIVVTTDDGYADNAEVGAPLLAAAGLPATWFVTAGRLGGHRFWWDRLTDALLPPRPGRPGSLEVALPSGPVWLDLRTRPARERALQLLHHRIRPLPPAGVEAAVDAVAAALGAPRSPGEGVTMDAGQLRALARLPGAEIGAHTLTHVQLRGQPVAVQRREIVGSVERLGALLGRPVTAFAYPYGSPRAVDRTAQRLVREAGCEYACSTEPGLAGPAARRRLLLPRLAVGDWPPAEFAARLSAALSARG